MTKLELKTILLSNQNSYCQEKNFRKHFPEVYVEMCNLYFPDEFKFKQKLYHYIEDDFEFKIGICPICGNRCRFISFGQGYTYHCSRKCIQQDEIIKKKVKNTWLNKSEDEMKCFSKHQSESMYNVLSTRSDEEKKKIRELGAQTLRNRSLKDKELIRIKKQKSWNSHTENEKENYSKRVSNNSKRMWEQFTPEKRNTVCKNISIATLNSDAHKNIWNNLSNEKKKLKLEKSIQTRRVNKTFNTSAIEESLAVWFENNSFEFYRQYDKDNRYPYLCDFYLPKYDLFIEIQGNWTHGKHPFNEQNDLDLQLLEKYKSKLPSRYYERCIYVWTIRDVEKRKVANKNDLNFLEIFSIDFYECVSIILNKIKELDKLS